MKRPGYVGELWAVTLEESGDELVKVQRVALGVDKSGLVTAEDRAELEGGTIYRDPGARRVGLLRVWYYRKRKQSAWWYHDTPGASCELVAASADQGAPFAWLESSGSVLCGPENFICE